MGNQVSYCEGAPSESAPKKPAKVLSAEEVEAVKEELIQEYIAKLGSDDDVENSLVVPTIVTAPEDPRFPATNQARHCFVRYNEYHKCLFERAEEDARCKFYKRAYESMCPAQWVEEWQELRDNGLWPGRY